MAAATEASQQANRSGFDPRRLVVIFLLISAFILALFFNHLLGVLWAQAGWSNPEVLEGLDWRVTTLIGVALAVGVAVVTYMNPRTKQLGLEVASELMKVTWPTWAETRVATVAVVIASLIAAVLLYGMDVLSYTVMVEWLPKIWEKL